MSTFGVTMMKDEVDVAYHVVAHMAEEGLAGVIVADNLSTDGTWDELLRAQKDLAGACDVQLVRDEEVGYYQSRKMTALAARAAEQGATWIVPFDADELWYCPVDRIGVWLETLGSSIGIIEAPLWNHFRTGLDAEDVLPFRSMTWRQREPGALPKVAFRWQQDATIMQGNHAVQGVRDPYGLATLRRGLYIRHFPFRSWEHFKQKAVNGAAAYAATDLPETEGAHWRGYGDILERHGEDALREVYDTYYNFLSPVDAGLIHDPAPFRRWT